MEGYGVGLVAAGVGGGEVKGGGREEARGHEAAVGDYASWKISSAAGNYFGDLKGDAPLPIHHSLGKWAR